MKPTFKNSRRVIQNFSTSLTFNEDKLELEIKKQIEYLRKYTTQFRDKDGKSYDLEKDFEYTITIDIQKNIYPNAICDATGVTVILISYDYKSILPEDIENQVSEYFLEKLESFCKNEIRLYFGYSIEEWNNLIKRGNDSGDTCYNYIKNINSDGLICGYLVVENEE